MRTLKPMCESTHEHTQAQRWESTHEYTHTCVCVRVFMCALYHAQCMCALYVCPLCVPSTTHSVCTLHACCVCVFFHVREHTDGMCVCTPTLLHTHSARLESTQKTSNVARLESTQKTNTLYCTHTLHTHSNAHTLVARLESTQKTSNVARLESTQKTNVARLEST